MSKNRMLSQVKNLNIKKLPIVTGFDLKIIAIVTMTIDHATWIFLDNSNNLSDFLHFIGRLTLPIICFLLVEGFQYSKDLKKYLLRLFIFALISQVPFTAMKNGLDTVLQQPSILLNEGNVLFNLLLTLLSLMMLDSQLKTYRKCLIICVCLFISLFTDWSIIPIVLASVLYYFKGDKKEQVIAYYITAMSLLLLNDMGVIYVAPPLSAMWMSLGILFAPIFWWRYEGERGRKLGGRYFFYWYYPVHMIALVLIKHWFFQ